MPVPVVKMVKLKVTYIPLEVTSGGGIRNIELYINDNYCLTEVEKMIQKEVGNDDEMLFYTYESNKLGKRLKKSSYVCRELAGFHLGAFPYKINKAKPSGNLYILDMYMKRQVKKMMFFNGEDQICMPFIMIVDGKSTCKEVHLQVFRYLFPILNLPKSLRDKLSSITDEDEKIETAFRL